MRWAEFGIAFGAWVLVTIGYLWRLRRILALKEAAAVKEFDSLAQRTSSWEGAFSGVSHRDWRQSALALTPIREALATDTTVASKARLLGELRSLLAGQYQLLREEPAAFPLDMAERAADMEAALNRTETTLEEYFATAADADFACRRFPLSLMAAAVGLRGQGLQQNRIGGQAGTG